MGFIVAATVLVSFVILFIEVSHVEKYKNHNYITRQIIQTLVCRPRNKILLEYSPLCL